MRSSSRVRPSALRRWRLRRSIPPRRQRFTIRRFPAFASEGRQGAAAGDGAPWVRTNLMNSSEVERAMPVDQAMAETMAVFATDADEKALSTFRTRGRSREGAFVSEFNKQMQVFF